MDRHTWAAALVAVVQVVASAQVDLLDIADDSTARSFTTSHVALECVYWQPVKWVLAGDGWYYAQLDGPALTGADALNMAPHFPGTVGAHKTYGVQVGNLEFGRGGSSSLGDRYVRARVYVNDATWDITADGGKDVWEVFLCQGTNLHAQRGELHAVGGPHSEQWDHLAGTADIEMVLSTSPGNGVGVRRNAPPGTVATTVATSTTPTAGTAVYTLATYTLRENSYLGGDGVVTGSDDIVNAIEALQAAMNAKWLSWFTDYWTPTMATVNTKLSTIDSNLFNTFLQVAGIAVVTGQINTKLQTIVDTITAAYAPDPGTLPGTADPLTPIEATFGTENIGDPEVFFDASGLGLNKPQWVGPTPDPGLQFSVPLASIPSPFGRPFQDFNVGLSGSVLSQIDPYISALHVVFYAGLTIWGMGRIWQELRVH